MITIALDAMGGDFGIDVMVPAALLAIKRHPDLQLILVGDESAIKLALRKQEEQFASRIKIFHAEEVVGMDESPALALKKKKKSSMRLAVNLVNDKVANACVSAGNTGALMATARFVLKTLPHIDRPAILTAFPTLYADKRIRVVDLGANVDSSPEHLLQFALMGSIVAEAVAGIEKPRVALLNIGTEAIKGNEQVKKAAELLENHPAINFIGNIEGNQIYEAMADVLVCDGFVGNIALKTSEGTIHLLFRHLKDAFSRNIWTKILAYCCKPIFKTIKLKIDPTYFNGANFVGLRGIVVKSHGSASIEASVNAISEAYLLVLQNIPEKIENRLVDLLEEPA